MFRQACRSTWIHLMKFYPGGRGAGRRRLLAVMVGMLMAQTMGVAVSITDWEPPDAEQRLIRDFVDDLFGG